MSRFAAQRPHLSLARVHLRPLHRLTAWATPRASIEETGSNVTHARGVAHAVKRLSLGCARFDPFLGLTPEAVCYTSRGGE